MATSAADITHFLRGTSFPADKQTLIENAKNNDADEETIRTIEQLPGDRYDTMADVEHEFSKVK